MRIQLSMDELHFKTPLHLPLEVSKQQKNFNDKR